MSDGRTRRSIAAVLLALTLAPRAARAEVPIEITSSDGRSYEVHRRTGETLMLDHMYGYRRFPPTREPVFASLCASTPCTASVPSGAQVLALSKPGGELVQGDPVLVTGPSRVTVSFHDRGDWRFVGWVVFFAAIAAGTGLLVDGGGKCEAVLGGCKGLNGEMTAGLVTMIAGPLAALPLIARKNGVSFLVEPLVLPSVARREGDPAAPRAEGLALTATF